MAIRLTCRCGKRLLLDNEFSGKRVKCSKCGRALKVPVRKAMVKRKRRQTGDEEELDFDSLAQLEQEGEATEPVTELTCPKCQSKFQPVAQDGSAQAMCPNCSAAVVVSSDGERIALAETSGEPETNLDLAFFGYQSAVEDARTKARAKEPGWDPTYRGLNLVYMAGVGFACGMMGNLAVIISVATVALVSLILSSAFSSDPQQSASFLVVGMVTFLLLVISGGVIRIIMIVAEEFLTFAIGFFAVTIMMTWLLLAVPTAMGGILTVSAGVILISAFAGLVGWCACLAVPHVSGAKIPACGATLCLLLAIASYFGAIYAAFDSSAATGALLNDRRLVAMAAMAYGFGVVGHLLFTLMLRAIAQYFQDDQVLAGVKSYLVYHICVMVAGFIIPVLIGLGVLGIVSTGFFYCVFLVLAIANMAWFLKIIGWVRDLIWQRFPKKKRRAA